jgi:hypothetical protein
MTHTKLMTATVLFGTLALAASAQAQNHQRVVVGQAVPRVGPAPRVLFSRPFHPYFYRSSFFRPFYYRPAFRIGLGFGYPYYGSYGYPYGYANGYPYGYPAYGSYGYGYYGRPYGGVRITDAPRDAEVYADGYYAGIVDDFDGVFQHLDLAAGPHKIEIRAQGHPPIAFDVRVLPGENITYRAAVRR